MSVAGVNKTKTNLIAWIEDLSDSTMLSFLDSLRNSKSENDWWEKLTESRKAHLNEGLSDVENGRVISSEEFWTKLKNG